MKLSEYFDSSVDKQIITVDNPTEFQICNLKFTCKVADKIRKKFGAITVTSGLRPAKKKYSQHEDGFALDFIISSANMKTVFKWIVDYINFDQVIYENKNGSVWIHMSAKRIGNRHQALVSFFDNETQSMKYKSYIDDNSL